MIVNKYNDIFNSSKPREDYALEGMVNHLYQLLGEDVSLVKDNSLLNAYMDAAQNGRIRPATVNGGEMAIGQFEADGYVHATDLTKNISVKSHEFLPSDQTLGLHFGSDAAESFQGGAGVDRIYAGAGNDTLQGNKGNDYLEGGAGADTYIWNNGDGSDTIIETADGSTNTLLINGVNLASLTLIKIDGEDSWLVENNASGIYGIGRNDAGDVFISVYGQAGVALTIKHHQDGDFGLNLNANHNTLEGSIRQTPITDAQGYLVVGDGVFAANDPYLSAKYSQRGELYNNRDMLFDAQRYFTNEDYYPLSSGSRGYLRNYAFEGGKGNDILEGSDWRAVQAA